MDSKRSHDGSSSSPRPVKDPRTDPLAVWQLNNAIMHIGPGPYQLIILLLGGGVYTAEGSLLLMLSVIAKSLIQKWQLSALFAGAMVSIVFTGLLAGTIIGGFLCDRYGRRMPILATYAGITLFLIASFMSPDILLLLTANFMLGVSLGFGVPAANAMVCESCPTTHRSNVYCMTMVLFSLGQMYTAVVIWVMSPNIEHEKLHWRGMLALATVLPMMLLIFSYFFLLESPHWLMMMHRYSEAKAVVFAMAHYKGTVLPSEIDDLTDCIRTPCVSPDISTIVPSMTDEEEAAEKNRVCSEDQRQSFWLACHSIIEGLRSDFRRARQLFSDEFFTTTMMMSYISFVSNFAYFGMIYGLPDTLKREQEHGKSSEAGWSPAAGVFFSAVFEIPGVFIAMVLGMSVGRRVNMTIAFGCTGMSLVSIVMVLFGNYRLADGGMLAVFSVKLFISAAFIVVYLYLLECYPTKCRATGLAFCMVVGRIGAFLCPFLYDGFALAKWHHAWFFVFMAVLVMSAAILSLLLPYETKDTQLMEDAAPLNDEEKQSARTAYPYGQDSEEEGYNTMTSSRKRMGRSSPPQSTRKHRNK
jgi:MFS family permease